MSHGETQQRMIVFVDHGGIKALEHHHNIMLLPDELRDLLQRRGPIHEAILVTDEPKLGRSDATKAEALRAWYNAGFTCVTCARSGMLKDDKETIDVVLIETVHQRLGMIINASVEDWHFVFVIGDSDYRMIIQTVLKSGVRTSAFLTRPCALLQKGLERQLFETLELYPKKPRGVEHATEASSEHTSVDLIQSAQDVQVTLRRLGRSSHRLHLTEQEQHALDLAMGSILRCARCGHEIVLERYPFHECNPNRLYVYECSRPANGPLSTGFMTFPFAEHIAEWISGRGAKEVVPWYFWQAVNGVIPNQLAMVLSLVDRLSWAVVDTALMLETCEKESLSKEEIEERFPLAILDTARDLELLMQADERFHSTTGDLPGFRPLIEEAKRRSQYPTVSRLIDPHHASRRDDLRELLLLPQEEREPFIQELDDRVTRRLMDGSEAIAAFSWEEALFHICQDVPRVSYEGCEALCALYRGEGSPTRVRLIFNVLLRIREQPQETEMLEMAERVLAPFPEGHRSLRFLDILIHTGVLEYVDERLRGTRPSHPAFQLLSYVQRETTPNIPPLTS